MNFSELHKQVLFDQSNRNLIWQPRILCWYEDKMFSGEGLPAPYTGLSQYDLYRELGCSNRLYEFNACFKRLEHPGVECAARRINETDREITISTPVGNQTQIVRRSPHSPQEIILKWEVETLAELKVATWRESQVSWQWDQETFDLLLAQIGDLGAPTMFMPRMNVQCLYLEKMGVERGVYAIFDWQDRIEAFFSELEACHQRLIEVINQSPIDIINFGENVHAGTLSPDFFLKYHLPACQRRCEQLHAAGKFVSSHWDGDVRPLLPYARETGLDGLEAITPRPQGDVTLEEIKAGLGDQMFFLDGIPAVYFDDTYSEEILIECAQRVIDLFAPRLVLGISDEISSHGDIERIRIVGDLVDRYNSQLTNN